MKKTLTINISGIVFHIDEDAYDKLKAYLSNLYNHFKQEESGSEIVSDIESRIAELFSERLSGDRKVIDSTMVEHVIEIMGMPEDFAEETSSANDQGKSSDQRTVYYQSTLKRLYRDPDSRFFGGVCSGLSHYFNLDKALVRVLFVIAFLITSGIVLLVYLILWIAVPLARTTSQRLEMRGEPITAENIGKTVKEDISSGKDNRDKQRNDYIRRDETNKNERSKAGSVLVGILGVIFIVISLFAFLGLIAGLVTSSRLVNLIPGFIPDFYNDFYNGFHFNYLLSPETLNSFLLSILLIAGIPILMIMYAGTKMLFNYKSNSRVIILSALGFWILGVIIAIGSALGSIGKYSSDATLREKYKIEYISDTLFVELDKEKYAGFYESKVGLNNVMILSDGGKEILAVQPVFDVETSRTGLTELKVKKYAQGRNYDYARKVAEEIDCNYKMEGNHLIIDPYFEVGKSKKWRSQELGITLLLPEGKVIYIDESLLPVMDNILNTSGTWKGDMTDKYWKMEANGLSYAKP